MRKLANEEMREMPIMPIMPEIPNNTTKGNGGVGVFRRGGQVRGVIGGFGRKRRVSEEGRESF